VKKPLIIAGVGLGVLFLAAVACGPNLKPRVDELENQVASLKAEKTTLEKQVQTLQPRVKELESKASNLEAEKTTLEKQVQTLKDIAGPPPASLDNFFPPKAPAPVFLLEMFALGGPFEGIMADLQEQDIAGAQANYEAFKAQYQKLAGMVPEWKDRFPMAPVQALGQALASGDPAQVGPAMGEVGKVCDSCHMLSLVKVQQKYHWPDFDQVEITDPLSHQSMHFRDYMMAMSGAFSGMSNDLRQGQLDNARKSFQAFRARFTTLAQEGCKQCHHDPKGNEIPRKYFVDESILSMIDQLGQALAATPPDAKAIEQLSGAIGNESCLRCHFVHFPAADTKARWEKFADLFK